MRKKLLFIFGLIFLFSFFLVPHVEAATKRSVSYYEKTIKDLKSQIAQLNKKVAKLEKENAKLRKENKTSSRSGKSTENIGSEKQVQKPYELWQVPSRPVVYTWYDMIEINPSSDKLFVTFNGESPISGRKSVFFKELDNDREYSYTWTYKEEGRQDSTFTEKVRTPTLDKLVRCNGVSGKTHDNLLSKNSYFSPTISLPVDCTIDNFDNVEFKSVLISISSYNTTNIDTIKIFEDGNLEKEINNIPVKPGQKKTFELPLVTRNGKVKQEIVANSFGKEIVYELHNLVLVDKNTGKEYTAFKR